jgi:hypothetical protein
MDLIRTLLYGFSLPERALRSTAAAVGGISRLMTDTLLPRSLRELGFYRTLVGNLQRFLIESLGQVETGEAGALSSDYLPRKMVGNVADAAGIFAFHFSPLWFLALAGDAATGTRTWLGRITEELVRDGALPEGSRIGSAERLLEALSEASSKSAQPLDTPPLTKEDLGKLWTEISASYAKLLHAGLSAIPTPEHVWHSLQEIRARDRVPLLTLSGTLAFAAARAVGKATGDLFTEKVLRSYGASLAEVRKRGFARFFAQASLPYLKAIAGAYTLSRRTLTERFLGRKGAP